MEVYLEYVIIDNLAIDFFLILLTRKTLRLEINYYLAVISAMVGTVFAVLLPVFNMNNGFSFVFKFFVGALIVISSGKFNTVREYILCFYLFLFYTFVFGGAIIAVFWSMGIDFNAFNLANDSGLPLGLSIGSATVLYLFLIKLIKRLSKKRDIGAFLRKCEIVIGGRKMPFMGFIDSGNSLFDKRSGMPVILCSPKAAKILGATGMLFRQKSEELYFSTVAGQNSMKIYKLDKLLIYNGQTVNTIYNVMIGISPNAFAGDDYDIILSPSLI
ncbi:MAG: sigma-E processing peptidase SpoIIGA [Clostridia bacterium]|nr:sigma-E processing peptidase SpoIIGA [Clostridia bacterium]